MQIIIHRGTHQIGGVATEIRTASTRILIDMGEDLGTDKDFVPTPLSIPGVTDSDGDCDAVLFTHNHGDHVGQFKNIREEIPLYMGELAKAVLLVTREKKNAHLKKRIANAVCFEPGHSFSIGDIKITPFFVDHSACDSYMFLIEADGKRILHTGDFRTHGFRGKALPKILDKYIGKIDSLIIEGTTLSRTKAQPMTERELQQTAKSYMKQYKYVFVLCASTNLERICGLSKAVPYEKFFVCDRYQKELLKLIEKYWGKYSPLFRNIRMRTYGENMFPLFQEKGFLMMVRDNREFRRIIRKFDKEQSIILYSMWDGYRTQPGSTLPDFLDIVGKWETLHTSGHASHDTLQMVIEKTKPGTIIPIHTDAPGILQTLCPDENIVNLQDGEVFCL